jgi:transcriptional regulator with XRE-family HTH domain
MTKARYPNMGDRLRRLREAVGLTQELLAHRAGLSSAAVFRIEQGRPSDPKLSTLVALARVLGMSVGKLADELTREDTPKPKGKKGGGR